MGLSIRSCFSVLSSSFSFLSFFHFDSLSISPVPLAFFLSRCLSLHSLRVVFSFFSPFLLVVFFCLFPGVFVGIIVTSPTVRLASSSLQLDHGWATNPNRESVLFSFSSLFCCTLQATRLVCLSIFFLSLDSSVHVTESGALGVLSCHRSWFCAFLLHECCVYTRKVFLVLV